MIGSPGTTSIAARDGPPAVLPARKAESPTADPAPVGDSRASPSLSVAARSVWAKRDLGIAAVASAGIALHLVLRFATAAGPAATRAPLLAVLALGGLPLVIELAV